MPGYVKVRVWNVWHPCSNPHWKKKIHSVILLIPPLILHGVEKSRVWSQFSNQYSPLNRPHFEVHCIENLKYSNEVLMISLCPAKYGIVHSSHLRKLYELNHWGPWEENWENDSIFCYIVALGGYRCMVRNNSLSAKACRTIFVLMKVYLLYTNAIHIVRN